MFQEDEILLSTEIWDTAICWVLKYLTEIMLWLTISSNEKGDPAHEPNIHWGLSWGETFKNKVMISEYKSQSKRPNIQTIQFRTNSYNRRLTFHV